MDLTSSFRWRWFLIVIAVILGLLGLGLMVYQATHEEDPHHRIREAYAKQQKRALPPAISPEGSNEVTIQPQIAEKPTPQDLQKIKALPEEDRSVPFLESKPPLDLSTQPQERRVVEQDSAPPPVFDEPAIPQALLDQTPPAKQGTEKVKIAVAPGRYRFNNQSPDAIAGNVVVTEDHTAKDYNLDAFAPEMEDIDLALLDHINSSALELDVAAGVWTPFYFQGHPLLEVGDKLRGQVTPGRQRDRLIVKFTKVIKKDGRSLPIQGISLAVDGTLGIPGEKVGNLFQAASGPLLAELIRGVSETFQDREKAVISGTGVASDIPSKTLKNAGIRGSQRVLEKIEELMSEELEENKPFLFVRAGTRLRCRLQTAIDVSQADYGK
jgi:type IV secretion system protein VirB10